MKALSCIKEVDIKRVFTRRLTQKKNWIFTSVFLLFFWGFVVQYILEVFYEIFMVLLFCEVLF